MSRLLLTLLAAALTACADGACDAEVSTTAEVVAAAPSPAPVQTPAPAPAPAPAPTPAAEPEPIIYCPQGGASTTVCPPSPTPAPVRPIVIDPNPTPPCVRDASIALFYVDPFWVDNCGNKYGSVSY